MSFKSLLKESETFGKPFWFEEARGEMKLAGVGDETSEPATIEQSSVKDFLAEQEFVLSVYEPTMETHTKAPCAPTQDLQMEKIEEKSDTNKINRVSHQHAQTYDIIINN